MKWASPRSRWLGSVLLTTLLALGACTTGSEASNESQVGIGEGSEILATPDLDSNTLVVNVAMTDTGFEPSTIFLPAGQHVELVLRNRGEHEHHYRVAGLVPFDLQWYVFPDVDPYELETMTDDELEALGITDEDNEVDHVLHHLNQTSVPFKGPSMSGIAPLPNEVHGYAQRGQKDIMAFFPLNPGEFVVEDVRYPEITGRVVVFEVKN